MGDFPARQDEEFVSEVLDLYSGAPQDYIDETDQDLEDGR
jgi:hypothetical protein